MLFAALIPLIIVSSVNFFTAENVIFNIQVKQLDVINRSKVDRVSQIINNIDKQIKEAQIDPIVLKEVEIIGKYLDKRGSSEYQSARNALDAVFQNMQRTSKFEDIYLVDLAGKIVYASDTGHAWQYLGKPLPKELLWKKSATQYGFSYSSIFLNTSKSGNYDFLVQAPLFDNSGKIYGSVVFEVPLLSFFSVIESRIGLGSTGESILLGNNKGQALTLSPLRFNKSSILETTIAIDLTNKASNSGYIEFKDYRNQESIGVLQQTPKMDFYILTMINKKEMFASINGLMVENGIIMVLATLLIVFAALWLSYSITRPLQSLAKATIDLKEKNFDVHIDEGLLQAKDEIGSLAYVFQQMIHELKNYYQSLQDLIQEVENSKEEALAANTAKSQFLANMSHELRTPLNAVIGYSELLMEDAEDQQLEGFVKDLSKIRGSAKHLLELINDILDLSKIEAGKIEIYLEEINIPVFVKMLSDLIQPIFEKNSNTFVLECPEDIGVMYSDATRVRQSILNLLSNASKFTKNGEVRLSISRHSGASGEEWIHFAVIDTGIGMTQEQLSKLFQAFTQAEATTTRKFGGTGLGLYLSKRFCEMLGGLITVESQYGKGTTFTMKLPVVSTMGIKIEEKRESVKTVQAVPDVNKMILIIDDEAKIHHYLEENLSQFGFRIRHAYNGEEGLKQARQDKPDLITLDVIMPLMDGWTTLSEFKKDPALKDIPIVMISSTTDKDLAMALKAADYLFKPINPKILIDVLNKHIGKTESTADYVMIVDDEPSVRDLLSRTIKRAGWNVVEAVNGRKALDYLGQAKQLPSLMLLDLMMPELDGFGVVSAMQENAAWREIPVIVVTAKDITKEEKEFLNLRAKKVFFKGSYSQRDLINEICDKLKSPQGNIEEANEKKEP